MSVYRLSCPSDLQQMPWMRAAYKELKKNVREQGRQSPNARILAYLNTTTLGRRARSTDKTHWCAAFVNWCFRKASCKTPNSARALSWRRWGAPLNEPIFGCLAVFRREKGGHVGFVVGIEKRHLVILGGNQSDSICIRRYPKRRLVSLRWPTRYAHQLQCI